MIFDLHSTGAVLALAHTVDDLVNSLERNLGVNGAELTVLFCLALGVLALLLMAFDRYAKKKALKLTHAGRFWAPDPYARSFHIRRGPSEDLLPDPVTHGPARDASNPRFRPEIGLLDVPDPFFPSLEEARKTAAASTDLSGGLFGSLSSPTLGGSTQVLHSPTSTVAGAPAYETQPEPPPALGTKPTAGWYQDPEGSPGSLRYWDGSYWTERRPV